MAETSINPGLASGPGTMHGHVEVFAQRGDFLHVAGWFRAPEELLAAEVPRLAVAWGDERREVALRRLRIRDDLPAVGERPAGRGFHVLMQAPVTEEPAVAFLLMGESSVALGPASLKPTPFHPRGSMAKPDRDGVRGWVMSAPSEQPVLLLEGCNPVPVELNVLRPDLPFDDGSGEPRFGFDMPLESLIAGASQDGPDALSNESLFDGKPRDLILLAANIELARQTFALSRDVVPAEKPSRRGPGIDGHVEVFAQRGDFLHVAGWFRAPEELLAAEVPRLAVAWGDERREVALRRLRIRDDLPAVGERPAGRGFHVLMQAPVTEEPAVAFLLMGESSVALGPASLKPTPFHPRGSMAKPDRDGVRGWVMSAPSEQPVLLLEGCNPVPVELNVLRPDLPFDDGSGEPRFGFDMPLESLIAGASQDGPDALSNESLFDGKPRDLILLAANIELARQTFALSRNMIGKLEKVTAAEAVGWVAERGRPQDQQTIQLMVDGTCWAVMRAAIEREDLIRNGVVHRGGGFRIALPPSNPTGLPGPLRIDATPLLAQDPLPGGTVTEAMQAWRPSSGETAFRMPADGRVPVAIIVPIHNAAAEVGRCIASVVRHTTGSARLILMNDASTDPAVADVLQKWADTPGIEVHVNPENLGFTRTVNRGIKLAGRDDVVLLNSDTIVGPGWLDGLRVAARSGTRTGTATALSNNAGAFSVPEINRSNPVPPWLGIDDMARLVRTASLSLYPVVPTGHGFCLYIRRECLDVVGLLDEEAFPRGYGEENDFCMRAARAGFDNVVDDRSFVWHQRSASFGAEKVTLNANGRAVLDERYPEYRRLVGMFQTDAAVLAVRWRVRRALQQAVTEERIPRPRVLFVISTESGGTPQTNRDLMEALSDRYEPWVLRCDSQVLTLTRYTPAGQEPPEGGGETETHRLERPIEPSIHGSSEYDLLLGDMLVRHGFELVHVRHLIWHGLGLPAMCQRLGIPVVFSFHDFYTVCPTIKLLDAEGRFCGGTCTQGDADCTAELWPASSMPPLRHRFVYRWRTMMEAMLANCDAYVTTSPSARDTLLKNFSTLEGRDFRVIPHGRSFARMEMLAAEPSLDEPLRVLVPGNVSISKGGGLIAAMAALDRGREVEFHVLGAVDRNLAEAPGIVLHGRYDRADFAGHVARIRPHLGAVLSLWPETYCHTLTECWSVGLPVVATAMGALAERIGANGGGWLVDRWAKPEAVLADLLRLRRDPRAVRERRNAVLDWQSREGRHWTTGAMAMEYDVLYRELFDRRLAFREEPRRPRVILTLDRPAGLLPTPLAAATRNALSRPFIYRPVLASFPFGELAGEPAEAVLVAAGALPPADLDAMRQRCAMVGLPLLSVHSPSEPGVGLEVGDGPELGPWLSVNLPTRNAPRDMPCRVLFVSGSDFSQLNAVRAVFDDLAALGVATLTVLDDRSGMAAPLSRTEGLPMSSAGGPAALRRAASEHDLGLAQAGPILLAMQAVGLAVLPLPDGFGDVEEGTTRQRDMLLLRIAELAADAPGRAALARQGVQMVRKAVIARPAGPWLDLQLAEVLASLTPSEGLEPYRSL